MTEELGQLTTQLETLLQSSSESDKLEYLRREISKDLTIFVTTIRPDLELAPIHYKLLGQLNKLFQEYFRHKRKRIDFNPTLSRMNRVLILLPRGHIKSTLLRLASLYLVINFSDIRIGWVQFSAEKAFECGRELRLTMERSLLSIIGRPFWPEPEKQSLKWSEKELLVNRKSPAKEATYTFFGLMHLKTGSHFDVIFFDDIVVPENVTTGELMTSVDKQVDYFSSLLDDPTHDMIIGAGTHYHFSDRHMSMRKSSDWETFVQPCYYKKDDLEKWGFPQEWLGDSIFPQRFNSESLESIKTKIGSYAFASQYELWPIPSKDQVFMSEWFRYFATYPDKLNIYILVDPASSVGKENDYSAIEVVGISSDFNIYRLEQVRQKLRPEQLLSYIFSLEKKWCPIKVAIESNGFQKYVKNNIYREQTERKSSFYIQEVKHGGGTSLNKTARIMKVQPLYEQGRIWHNPQMKGGEQEQELLQMPFPTHDDSSDCFSMILEVGWKPELDTPQVRKREKKNENVYDEDKIFAESKQRGCW